MKKILVVNGEKYWQDILPEFEVTQKSIQKTSWILKNGKLFVADENGVIEPDGILNGSYATVRTIRAIATAIRVVLAVSHIPAFLPFIFVLQLS